MEFRPCIDIHDGKVKQIVGGSINDSNRSGLATNFVADQDAGFFADFYKERGIKGGHVILLNKSGTEEYELTKKQALLALRTYPGGLQIGGGITAENAREFIDAGASHVIVTSYVFRDGAVDYDRLDSLVKAVGKEHLVLDLSCRKKDGKYYIVTDRWQKFTDEEVTADTLQKFEKYCDEYLIHAVDVEGKQSGVDSELLQIFADYLPGKVITYAGGVHSYEDIGMIKDITASQVNVTVGSALDIFGGKLNFEKVLNYCCQDS